MGRVYRARDTRLGRNVALKVLPDEVSRDRRRQARFEQEARSASALNHPNIVCTYDIGSDDGILYVASELVEGESLGALIARGPVPPARLLDIAIQLVEGVGAAHAAGLIHRDLKPENILLTRDGRVKIIDFGLAKQIESPSGERKESAETVLMTEPGVLMGTPAYMSPEQVRAQPADHRSDLFSLGGILYEMASGKPAFSGNSKVEVMHAVLRDDPVPLPSSTPRDLDLIVRRCLEKLPERRFQTCGDLAFALARARDALNRPRAVRPRWVLAAAWASAAALLAGIAGSVIYHGRPRATAVAPRSEVRINPQSSDAHPLPAPKSSAAKAATVAPGPVAARRAEIAPVPPPQPSAVAPLQLAKPETPPVLDSERTKSLATAVAMAMVEARYNDAAKDFTDQLKASLSVDRLRATWELTRQNLGNLRWATTPFPHGNLEIVWLEFEHGVIDLKAGFAGDGRLTQIWYNAFAAPQAAAYGVQTAPNNIEGARTAFGQADYLLQQQKNEDAIKRFDEAIRDSANYTAAYKGRCQAFIRTQQYGWALVDCTHAIHLNGEDAQQYRYRGDAAAGLKRWDDAIVAYDQAIRLKPDDNVFYNQRAWAYLNESQYDLCIENATKGIQLNAKSVALRRNRSSCYDHLQKYGLALEDATQLVNLTKDPKDYYHRGSLYNEAKQYQRAIADFNEAIRLKSDYKEAYTSRGFAKDMLGDTGGAEADRKYARELPQ